MEEYDNSDIIKILVAASELNLKELITYIQSFLIKNKVNWMEQNFYLIYQTSFENDSFLDLQKYCTDLMSKEPDKLFNSPNLSLIPEKLLISIIQNDNLQMSEIQIWDHVLKWGLAQNPQLPSDVTNYSKDDFNTLKNTLQQCVPFIRFYDLSSKEFTDKVLPYKRVLPKELYKDLLKTFLNLSDPDSRPSDNKPRSQMTKEIEKRNVDSKIITYQHAELISKWIKRLEITDKLTSLYEFKLLFRGSRDGLTSFKFHRICDNISPTVTIVKVKNSNEILGGYNPIGWKSDGSYGSTKDSFIFSFNNFNINEIDNFILSRVINEHDAIFNGIFNGPSFGNGDLIIWGTNLNFGSYCHSKVKSYEKSIRKNEDNFDVEECEVFQIV